MPLTSSRVRESSALSVLLGLGIVLTLGETPLWWFGGALLCAALAFALRAFAGELATVRAWASKPRRVLGIGVTPSALCAELVCVGIITGLASVMMREILNGERPVSHDHTVHYVRAWLFHNTLLPKGHIVGWSHSWFAGHPIGYLYPPGVDLWVNAVHALGLGALSFSKAYAAAFWLFHVFTGIAMYRFARTIGGRTVALIAAILCLTDLAFFRMGGWAYTVEYGVWPQALSLNFALLALCSLPAIAEKRTLAPLGAFGIWMGLAIVCHPIQLFFFVPLVVAAALAAAFAHNVHAITALFRLGASCLLAMGVAAFWLIPFMTSRGESNSMGVWWDTTYEMGKGLLDLDALPGTLGYVIAFGVLGLCVFLKTRRFALLFTSLMALGIPAISNSTFIDEFHLTNLAGALNKVQFIRLSTMAKPFWFVLAAYLAVAAVVHAKRLVVSDEAGVASKPQSPFRAAALAACIGLLMLPVLVPAARAFWVSHVAKSMTTESDRALLRDRIALEQWLLKNLPKNDGFYRVGVMTGHNHDLMDLATLIDHPIYKRGFTPASNFIYQPEGAEPEILEAINFRFAISKVLQSSELYEKLATFGAYAVYRFKRWHPEPFQIVEGKGDVRMQRFDDEEILLQAMPGSAGKLRLSVSYFSRWQAYRDGTRIPISMTYLHAAPQQTGFMTVALAPGSYRFVFERTWGDRLAVPLALLVLLLCVALVLADRRWQRFAALAWLARGADRISAGIEARSARIWSRHKLVLGTLTGLTLFSTAVALARWTPAIVLHDLGKFPIERVRFDFLEELSGARARIDYQKSAQRCVRQNDRLVCRDAEGNLDIDNYVASNPSTLRDYILVRCIRARPVEKGLLRISYPNVTPGDAIIGYYGIERHGRLMSKRRPVAFQILMDERPVYVSQTESDNKIHEFKVSLDAKHQKPSEVTFTVRADNISRRFFCFNAQMVDLP